MNSDTLAVTLAATPPRQARQLAEAELMRRDMRRYMRWAWPLDPAHGSPLLWNYHLDAKCELLKACRAGEVTRAIINEPPRFLKSWTVSVAFPSWVWTDNPGAQFLAASADRDVALRDADAMRDLCQSTEYRETFRPKWNFRGGAGTRQQDAKGYFRNSAGGHRISKAMGAKSQGANADYVIFDDPLDAADAYSDKAALVTHVDHARQKFMTRLNDEKTGVVILIMQRLHELDLSGVFLADGGWEHLYLPAEYDGPQATTWRGWTDPRTEPGELLFPERLGPESIAQKKVTLGARGYAGQYQQQPAPAAGAMLLRDWLHFWAAGEIPEMDYTIGSWDCTFASKTSDADYVVGQTWGVAGERAYLLDQCRRKMSTPEMLAAIREQHRKWPHMRAIVIEQAAAGRHVMATLEGEIYGVEGFDPKGTSKEERLAATLPRWEQGLVLLPHPVLASVDGEDYSWVRDLYVPELVGFPAAAHDDQVDATSQALIWIQTNGPSDVYLKAIG